MTNIWTLPDLIPISKVIWRQVNYTCREHQIIENQVGQQNQVIHFDHSELDLDINYEVLEMDIPNERDAESHIGDESVISNLI